MTPYYQDGLVTIYHGDCREIMADIVQGDTCITDPVWPNSVFPDVTNPAKLFAEMCTLLMTERLVVHLGCMSDPRFLLGVPASFPFLRVCWLAYAIPGHRGRILVGSDVAYAFGPAPSSRPGRRVLGGQVVACRNDLKTQHSHRGNGTSSVDYGRLPHPAPRRLEHVRWLVGTFAETSVFDPFCGTGTTLLAAKERALPSIGIEAEERYCEIAATRMAQEVLPLDRVAERSLDVIAAKRLAQQEMRL